jgi:hypothetical protein
MEPLPTMKIQEFSPELLCSWMPKHGKFGRMGVLGDGSCFFHSVCALKNRDNYLYVSPKKQKEIAYEFRCQFAKNFTKEEYKKFSKVSKHAEPYETEHDGFCSPKVWADEVMIRHASKILNLNLIFLDLKNFKAYCGVHGHETQDSKTKQSTGLIAWVGRSHFEPIIRIDDAEEGLITTIFEPHKNEQDANLVESIMDKYFKSCEIE